ncbi:MAG: ExbD/TolR family protein [Magnetospirillum sp.]
MDEDPDDTHDSPALTEINTTPLIDVLLVLLVMLIITMPAPTHKVETSLAPGSAAETRSVPITIAIDSGSGLRWNGQGIDGRQDLEIRLAQLVAAAGPPPDIHLRVDRGAPYGAPAMVMAALQRHGISRFGIE